MWLPDDILIEIFERSIDEEDNRKTHAAVIRVCRQWHILALSLPEFWTTIVFRPRILDTRSTTAPYSFRSWADYLQCCLRNGRELPLSVVARFNESSYIEGPELANLKGILALLVGQADRATSLTFHHFATFGGQGLFVPFMRTMVNTSRKLKRLHIESDVLLSDLAPSQTVTSLALKGTYDPHPVMRSFRSLEALHLNIGYQLWNPDLLTFPNLRVLTLVGYFISSMDPVGDDPIRLPRLETLSLKLKEFTPPSLRRNIMAYLETPALRTFRIYSRRYSSDCHPFLFTEIWRENLQGVENMDLLCPGLGNDGETVEFLRHELQHLAQLQTLAVYEWHVSSVAKVFADGGRPASFLELYVPVGTIDRGEVTEDNVLGGLGLSPWIGEDNVIYRRYTAEVLNSLQFTG